VVGFQEKGSERREEVVGAELVREEVRERGVNCDADEIYKLGFLGRVISLGSISTEA